MHVIHENNKLNKTIISPNLKEYKYITCKCTLCDDLQVIYKLKLNKVYVIDIIYLFNNNNNEQIGIRKTSININNLHQVTHKCNIDTSGTFTIQCNSCLLMSPCITYTITKHSNSSNFLNIHCKLQNPVKIIIDLSVKEYNF